MKSRRVNWKEKKRRMTKEEIRNSLSLFPDGWDKLLAEEKEKPYYQDLISQVSDRYRKETVFPPYNKVFHALELTSPGNIKCVIIGQDPYYNPGQANGLAFSVNPKVALPKSLRNIYKELFYEFGYPIPKNGCLDDWAKQGVLLLNASLTVTQGEPNSHSRLGWQTFTDDRIKKIDTLDKPIVYLLWGKYAQSKAELIHNPKACIIKTSHPSPLSANRGFFCSDCFKKCNRYLKENGIEEIDFRIKD